MNNRIDKQGLLERLAIWDGFLKKKINLIACGGTAMTLLGIKDSTKDIDLLVPESTQYDYLLNILKQLGYKSVTGNGWAREGDFVFDLFKGKSIHTTELLESPLKKDRHIFVAELNHIYFGALNYYDLIISKIFRSSSIDIEDCKTLVKAKKNEIEFKSLKKLYYETAAYDISEYKVIEYFKSFIEILKKEGIFYEK
ncbi:MAG: hypothetical protein A2551_04085 [Elusimicrobia bacterium RIFOXYD2_FULL_34_30]|nr:MAG: hypothetical protein A2551_04085 [Elusimicrobia bacterium RIFOXYD2_FULL_34_30]